MSVIDNLANRIFGMTSDEAHEAGVCIRCKKEMPNVLADIDWREYKFSALCPSCFDQIMQGSEERDDTTEAGL